ncbi:MAG: hypothetical protein AB1397_03350, partial [bacterium]
SIFLLLRIEDNPSYKNIAFAGISLGLSALARANILLFIPFLLIWMLRNSKLKTQNSKLLRYGFLCLIVLLTISPVTIRNYLASGKFVLISTNGPVNLWIGNNPYATGGCAYPPSDYSEKIYKKVKEKGNRAYIEEVLRFIKKEPKRWLFLLFRKFFLFWSRIEMENNINTSVQKGYSSLLNLPIFIGFGIIVPLGLTGIFLSTRLWKKIFLLYIYILCEMCGIVIMFVLGRYRICFVPVLIIFSSFCLFWWYEKIKKEKAKVFFSLIPLTLFISLVYSQDISGRLYPLFHPGGIHFKKENVVIIKDNSDDKKINENPFILKGKDKIKKELIITEDLQEFKEAILFLAYTTRVIFYPPNRHIPEKGGRVTININEKTEKDVYLSSTNGFVQNSLIELDSNFFYKGKNVITISSIEEGVFLFPIDESLDFKRSFFLKEGKWERIKNGEFMIWLELVR